MSPRKPRRRGTGASPVTVNGTRFLVKGTDERFRRLIYGMHALALCLGRLRNRVGGLLGLTGSQYQILLVAAELEAARPATVNAIAEMLHLSAPFVTKEIGALLRRRLVRKAANPRDRREVLVGLTAHGRAALASAAPGLRQINDDFFRGVSAKEFFALCRLTAKLTANIDLSLTTADRIARRPPA